MVAANYEPYSLLIADDDEACLDSLREAFEPEGYQTFLADSGTAAVRVVRRHRIHVAIFDMQMPGMTGLEVVKVIHTQVERRLPCVLMSGNTTRELERRALAEEVVSLLRKPLNLNEIRSLVSNILRTHYA